MTPVRTETSLGLSPISLETGKLAKQADGAVLVQQGETIVLVTAVKSAAAKPGILDFVPLSVDYREKMYAAGKIPGGFFKREARPTEHETLTARLIDRPIRPLFPNGMQFETQIMAQVISSDGEHAGDVLALIGSAVAVGLSPMELHALHSAVRVAKVDGQLVVNPTNEQTAASPLDVVVVGTREGIIMIESELQELADDEFLAALQFAYDHILTLIDWQEAFIKQAGKPKRPWVLRETDEQLVAELKTRALPDIERINGIEDKQERYDARVDMTTRLTDELGAINDAWTGDLIRVVLHDIEEIYVRSMILDKQTRSDGRSFTQIRTLDVEVGVIPRTHGSGLFTRGQTQSLSVTTLGTGQDEQRIEALEGKSQKRFYLHYNFPSFSVGEARPVRGPGRREIGHGALAERALRPVMPTKEEFPYTVRIVSEVLESNGSSSMATVCAGALSLLDAGVPIKSPVAGIAMGMVSDDTRNEILTDIAGLEDHYGDMDFKVAGTKQGVTAVQLDVKLKRGLTMALIKKTLAQAKQAREEILQAMTAIIATPRAELSQHAPRITVVQIDVEKIGAVIGPGGKMIRKIIEETGASIDVEDDGRILVASSDGPSSQKAVDMIKGITAEVEVGKTYKGKITRLMNFGAFCEILPGKEGLIHVSELDRKFIDKVEDVISVGDEMDVKVIEVDMQKRINLSRKALLPALTPEEAEEQKKEQRERPRSSRSPSRDGGRDRGGRRPERSGSRSY